jgi:hypothetical protein
MTTIQLTTLTVHVLNAAGKEMFDNPRFLRVVTKGADEGKFAVARHGKALLVKAIARPDAVTVDSTAARIDLADTRASKLADIGVVATPAKPKSPPAIPSDLPALIAKYEATIKRVGVTFIQNALVHTKDVVKREAMETALANAVGAAPKAKRKGKASEPKAAGVNVAELAKALADSGVDGAAIVAALTKAA